MAFVLPAILGLAKAAAPTIAKGLLLGTMGSLGSTAVKKIVGGRVGGRVTDKQVTLKKGFFIFNGDRERVGS